MAPNQQQIQDCFDSLMQSHNDANGKEHGAFKMTDEVMLCDCLGVKVQPLENGTIKLSQPHMISKILKNLGMSPSITKKWLTAASTSVNLMRDIDGQEFKEKWSCQSVIDKLNFLEKSTQLDLSYVIHQCAILRSPKGLPCCCCEANRSIPQTHDKGMVLNLKSHPFDFWVDASFVGDWNGVTMWTLW